MTISKAQTLLNYQNLLLKQVEEILKPAEASLNKAKADYHEAKIAANRLLKQANEISFLISEEEKQELQSNNDWQVKSNSEMLDYAK
jgi:hypothetical protein